QPPLIGPEQDIAPRREIGAGVVDADHLPTAAQALDIEALERWPAAENERRLIRPCAHRHRPRRHFRRTLRTNALPASSADVFATNAAALTAADADRDAMARLIASR